MIFEQPLPDWGIAIWDEQGVCILTNENRILTDVQAIGTNGSNSAGFSINTTLPGKFGIVPSMSGLATGVITDGGTRPWSSQYFFSAVFNGGAITGDVSIEGGNLNLRASTPGGGWPFLVNFQAGQGNNLTYARL